jgi:hypothetical protein
MKKTTKTATAIMLLAFLWTVSIATRAQAPSARVLTGEGLKKLGVFLGTWKAESVVDAAHPGPISATYTCQWSPNGRYLVADQLVNNNGKETNNLSIYTYNVETGNYTLSLVGIPGMQPFSIGVVAKGDTLFYNSEFMNGGKKVYNRTLNVFSSTTDYIYKVQFSHDGVNWRTDGEGKARKFK